MGPAGRSQGEIPLDLFFHTGEQQQDKSTGPSSGRRGHGARSGSGQLNISCARNGNRQIPIKKKDKWIPSKTMPRLLGVASFLFPILGIVVQYSVALGCDECWGSEESGFNVPYNFSIGDTLKSKASYVSGLCFMVISCMLLVGIGWSRHQQVRLLCGKEIQSLARQATIGDFCGGIFVVYMIVIVAIHPVDLGSLEVVGNVGSCIVAVGLLAVYCYTQIFKVESFFVSRNIIKGSMHTTRKGLMVTAILCVSFAASMLISRDILGPSTNEKELFYTLIGILLLGFEFGFIMAILASFGITDFSSMEYNKTALENLRDKLKKSQGSVSEGDELC